MRVISLVCAISIGCIMAPSAHATSTTREVVADMIADNHITENEKTFLNDWAGLAEGTTLTVDGRSYEVAPLDEADRRFVTYMAGKVNLNELWLSNTNNMQIFIRIAELNQPMYDRLVKFAASKFYSAWEASEVDNMFQPIRDRLDNYKELVEPLEVDERRTGRQLAYDAMAMIDADHNDEVNDIIYAWMKPNF